MLPVLFIVLASAALAVALAALFLSLRASLAGPSEEAWASAGPDRGALADEKNALLRALKDLEYEHEVGKIDDEDYAKLERAYRARAKEVLGELDRDLRPYLSRAESLASGIDTPLYRNAGKKKKKKNAPAPEAKAPPESESETRESENADEAESAREPESVPEAKTETAAPKAASPVCPKCATVNDADAAFCKKCATPLASAEASS